MRLAFVLLMMVLFTGIAHADFFESNNPFPMETRTTEMQNIYATDPAIMNKEQRTNAAAVMPGLYFSVVVWCLLSSLSFTSFFSILYYFLSCFFIIYSLEAKPRPRSPPVPPSFRNGAVGFGSRQWPRAGIPH